MSKSHIIFFAGLLFLCLPIAAQNEEVAGEKREVKSQKDGLGVGFKLGQVSDDFGLGIDITSPTFVHHALSVRMNTLYFFREHFSFEEGANTWTPYFVGRLGIVGIGGKPAPFLRLYGEGGFVFGIGDDQFTSEANFFGGYGLFGFEFFMSPRTEEMVSYYIELGGTGSGGQADKMPGKPIYHDGFTIGTGFRFYF